MPESGPHLNMAVFCEQVIEDKSGVLSLIRIVDRMHIQVQGPNAPEQMPPADINWWLVLMFKSGRTRGSQSIKIEPETPSGLRKQPVIMSGHFEGGIRGVNIVTRMAMRAESPGLYWFRIYVEDQFVTQIPMEIIYSRTITPAPPAPPPALGM